MKNKGKVLGILVLMIFSFYYTEKIAVFVQDKTPLKKKIVSYKKENNILSVNAYVNGDYITPGLNGIEVDVNRSYKTMRTSNVFSEKDIVYKEVKPELSISDYKDKVISGGNSLKKSVSIVIDDSYEKLKKLLSNSGVHYSLLKNNYYCFYELDSNCYSKQKVKFTYVINNDNFSRYVDDIKSGDILYLEETLKSDYLNILINRIYFFNYKIVSIEELLSETLLN